MIFFKRLLVTTILIYSLPAYSLQTFRDEWRNRYPDSNSDEITSGTGCQLCHVNPAGSSPWNAYGITIRDYLEALGVLGGGATAQQLNEAFDVAEGLNLDNDPSGATSLTEINNHYQPGWTVGANNTITNSSGNETNNQSPPSITVDSTTIDPAVPSVNTLPQIPSGNIVLSLETIADGFVDPVMAARAPGLPGYLFVVQQAGEIWRVDLFDGSSVLFHDVDLATGVALSAGGERGLLGLAFDPEFITNGHFYTYQSESIDGAPVADFSTMPNGTTADHQTVISEWTTVNPASINSFSVQDARRVIMRIDQPQSNHNGGMISFGPDGALYISLGDGGGADDQGFIPDPNTDGHGLSGNGSDNDNPLGSILRINPSGNNSANGQYGIPTGNFFVDEPGLDEIYAYGFRNPYRFSFDSLCFEEGQDCNTLLLGDVGQGEVEEVNNVISGGNYGWNWKEGSFFFYRPTPTVYGGGRYISLDAPPNLPDGLIDPIAEYNSSPVDGRSVVGGYIYRGSEIPELVGLYVFADYFERLYYIDANNTIRKFRMTSAVNFIAGFGEDENQELYVLSRGATGALQKLVADTVEELCVPIKAINGNIALICL